MWTIFHMVTHSQILFSRRKQYLYLFPRLMFFHFASQICFLPCSVYHKITWEKALNTEDNNSAIRLSSPTLSTLCSSRAQRNLLGWHYRRDCTGLVALDHEGLSTSLYYLSKLLNYGGSQNDREMRCFQRYWVPQTKSNNVLCTWVSQ